MQDALGAFDGLELVVATTAEDGVRLARSKRPTVIVMDVNLPRMSGIEVLRVLRDDEETARIPVIALTAAATEQDRQRSERAGFASYLTKPVRISELLDVLDGLIAQRLDILA